MKTSVLLDKNTTNFEYQFHRAKMYMGSERPSFFVIRLNQLDVFLSPDQMIKLARVANRAVEEID